MNLLVGTDLLLMVLLLALVELDLALLLAGDHWARSKGAAGGEARLAVSVNIGIHVATSSAELYWVYAFHLFWEHADPPLSCGQVPGSGLRKPMI